MTNQLKLSERTTWVFHEIKNNPKITANEIAVNLGLQKGTGSMYVYIKRLVEAGAIFPERHGKEIKYLANGAVNIEEPEQSPREMFEQNRKGTLIPGGIIQTAHGFIHKCGDSIHGDRGRAQTVRTRSYGFASTEIII